MIEAVMYVALGFCTAGLLCLAILPAFYRRAARLTEDAIRAVNPTSYAEVRAAQDHMRAQHAVDLRRAELQLDAEREKAAKHHAEVSRLTAEKDALAKAHKAELADLNTQISESSNDKKAVDLLSAEVTALKQKLATSEKELAESWKQIEQQAEVKENAPQQDEADADWLPATDTLALATITGLEAEVASLKAKLAKFEPSVASEVDNERTETAKTRLADLEAQLVDTESKFVTAQAEVTRLSLQLEAHDIKETDLQKHLAEQLDALATENAQHLSQLKAKERTVERLTGQIGMLQQDLIATSTLAQVRQEFRQLVEQLSSGTPKSAKNPVTSSSAEETPQTKRGASELKPKKRARKSQPTEPKAQQVTQADEKLANEKPTDVSSTADIASAAEALVSRIMASNRKKDSEDVQKDLSTEDNADAQPTEAATVRRKTRANKLKKKDVA